MKSTTSISIASSRSSFLYIIAVVQEFSSRLFECHLFFLHCHALISFLRLKYVAHLSYNLLSQTACSYNRVLESFAPFLASPKAQRLPIPVRKLISAFHE